MKWKERNNQYTQSIHNFKPIKILGQRIITQQINTQN